MSSRNEIPQVSIKPEEGARLPMLEAQIEREWRLYRPQYVKQLLKENSLKSQVHETALWCIETMDRAAERGANPDQQRELMQPLIQPEWDRS
jgi:hypothetical protein